MKPKKRVVSSRRGLSTVAAIFSLLLMFAALVGIVIAYFDYNIAANEQMQVEHERSQEKIILRELEVDDEFNLLNVMITNNGTIEVKIRAIYEAKPEETTFLFDPSDYADTYVAPTESLIVDFPFAVTFDPTAKLVAATERGVKTMEYEPLLLYGPNLPTTEYDPTKLYIGPLMLQFDAFWYQKTNSNGDLDPNEPWTPGWSIPKGFGDCAWNITVMNIDNRNITINRYTSFTAVPNDSPSSVLSWHLEPTTPTFTQLLPVNQTEHIVYIWKSPKSLPGTGGQDKPQKMNLPGATTCMVFLTFFGVFNEQDGTTTPYAQTIPFEAAITVTG